MENSINHYMDAFNDLVEQMCMNLNVRKAKVRIEYDEHKSYPNGASSKCDITFNE